MAFSVERTKEKITIYGQQYEIKQPTVNDAIEMSKKGKAAEKNPDLEISAMESLRDWVTELGVPKEVVLGMETKHFLSLVEYLSQDPKKKAELIAGS